MPRNLDITALRSFVAVAETGGVTKAAGFLNLTQSAVSMQLKRLEEGLDVQLLDRSGRQIQMTPSGEQLFSYARRMVQLNDELVGRMTGQQYEGEITIGVPHDIISHYIPGVLKAFHAAFPRVRVHLESSFTRNLLEQFARGECDLILTTETAAGPGAQTLARQELLWVGAPDGMAWRQRPLPLAFETNCLFRPVVQRALDAEGVDWTMAVNSDSTRTVEATVRADLAVHAIMESMVPDGIEPVSHRGALPALGHFVINLYVAPEASGPAHRALADLVRDAYAVLSTRAGRAA